jgi:hypothetical protein
MEIGNKLLVFINWKHMEHMVQKQVIDPITHMVLVTQRWNKIFENLQNLVHAKELRIRKMYKDKWN